MVNRSTPRGGSGESISMLSQATGLSASGAGPTIEWRVAKCLGRHACPPSTSADFFREIANRRVKIGLKLGSDCKD